MSTLKTHNLQSADSGSVNIALAPNAGMVVTGISTFSTNVIISGVSNFQSSVYVSDSIHRLGDADTKIRFPAADTFSVETAGSERLRISSAGQSLITGTLKINDGSTSTNRIALGNSGDLLLYNGSNENHIYGATGQPIIFSTNTVERFRITSAGLVGIGTDTPYNPLAVVGSSADIMVYDTDAYSQNVSGGAVAFAGRDSAGNRKTLADVRGVANGANIGEFAIRTRRTGGTLTEALRIDSSGRLLVGGTSIGSASSYYDDVVISNTTSGTGAGLTLIANATNGFSAIDFADTAAGGRGRITYSHADDDLRIDVSGSEALRIASDGKIGINQTSPQALLHIGNYETGQNVQQSTVTQYFIDSTRSLKIARQSAGNVTTSARWYTVATLALGGFSYRCQVSLGGNFTQDVVDIEIQSAYGASLNNKYSFQMTGKAACAHSNNRITKARVTTAGLLQVWIANGVDSNTTAKVVLETTCGIYAQNGADNAYPMPLVVDNSSPSIITHHLLNFGVHAQWTWTINSSSVRSYTRLSGEEFCGAVNAGNGSSHGVNNTFNAPMDGLYHVDFHVASISATADNNCLINFYGSMTYNTQNNVQNNDEVYDPRGCSAGTQPQQGTGFSTVLKMAKGDYFTFDFYRPGGGNGYTDGGGQGFDISVHKIQ